MQRGVLRSFVRNLKYLQGQSSSPKTREYFYYIDHQGQLFLDDTKVKNFITCFKDKKFLTFFFRRVKRNESGRYGDVFPFVSPCGPETNYIRCDDLPVVFTHLLDQDGLVIEDIATYGHAETETSSCKAKAEKLGVAEAIKVGGADMTVLTNDSSSLRNTISKELLNMYAQDTPTPSTQDTPTPSTPGKSSRHSTCDDMAADACLEKLSYGGTGDLLTHSFHPKKLFMLPDTGRVYHAGPAHLGGVGLVKSSLAIELSRFFVYEEQAKENSPPKMFRWRGKTWELDNSTHQLLHH